jgi:glutaredoxin
LNTPEIIVYARERYCPDVTRTRDRLTELGLPWIEHDIEADADAAATVEKLTGMRRVPTVIIGESVLVEPLNDELDETLRSVGFDVDALATTAAPAASKDGFE